MVQSDWDFHIHDCDFPVSRAPFSILLYVCSGVLILMYQRILHGVGKRVVPALIGIATAAKNSNTRSDYWEHDPSDFDY